MTPSLLQALTHYLKFGYCWLSQLNQDTWKVAKLLLYGKKESSIPVGLDRHPLNTMRLSSSRLVSDRLKFSILLDDGSAILDVRDSRVSRWGVDRITLPGDFKESKYLYYVIDYLTHYHSFLNLEPLHNSQQTAGLASLDITRLGPRTGVTHPSLRHPDGRSLITDGVANIIADPKIPYGFRITNETDSDLYAYLYFLDNHDFSIAPYYISPNTPLKARQSLTIGYGTNPGPPAYAYFLREGADLEVGFLKLLVSKEPLNGVTQVEQHISFGETRDRDRACLEQVERLICDTVTVSVVQRKS